MSGTSRQEPGYTHKDGCPNCGFRGDIPALRAKLKAAERENKRYRKALLWIRSQLSCTLVPRNVWVKKLHGQIFMVCQTELEPE